MIIKLLTGKATRRLLVSVFVIVGIAALYARTVMFESDLPYQEDRVWRVSVDARIEVSKRDTLVYVAQPYNSKYIKLISEQVNHPGMRLLTYHDPQRYHDRVVRGDQNGEVQLHSIYYFQESPVEEFTANKEKLDLTPEQREHFLRAQSKLDLSNPLLINFNQKLTSDSTDIHALTNKLFQAVRNIITDDRDEFSEIRNILTKQRANNLGRARLLVALFRLNRIPARINTGLSLTDQKPVKPVYWVTAYDEDLGWTPYDPINGFSGSLPRSYVRFNRGNEYFIDVSNGQIRSISFAIEEDIFTLLSLRHAAESDLLNVLDLRRLDIDTRNTLMLLLLLPLGVLISSFSRHILGLFPYGTFTATLLALAVIYADTITTVIMGTIVIILASLGRALMPKTLTRVPRLSLIFTFVAMAMVASVSILDYFDLGSGGHTILLPIVIFTSLVDRFYSYWDAAGMHSAMIRLGVTVLIAMFCVPVLQNQALGQILLRYPEIHLFTAALMLGFSAYSHKKLTDFPALKLLGENKPKKRKAKLTDTAATPTPE